MTHKLKPEMSLSARTNAVNERFAILNAIRRLPFMFSGHTLLARTFHRVGWFPRASQEVFKLIQESDNLGRIDEATILTCAIDHVNQLRKSYALLCSVEAKEQENDRPNRVSSVSEFKEGLRNELVDLLKRYVTLIDARFVQQAQSAMSRVLFLKMRADFYRYLAEQKEADLEKVQGAYEAAYERALSNLGPGHHVTLSVALNYSVFMHDVAGNSEQARQLAQLARDSVKDMVYSGKDRQRVAECVRLIDNSLVAWSSM